MAFEWNNAKLKMVLVAWRDFTFIHNSIEMINMKILLCDFCIDVISASFFVPFSSSLLTHLNSFIWKFRSNTIFNRQNHMQTDYRWCRLWQWWWYNIFQVRWQSCLSTFIHYLTGNLIIWNDAWKTNIQIIRWISY